jgi:alpha-glucoside transport system permease protein
MIINFVTEQPKLLQLLYGLVAFCAIVGVILFLLDRVPKNAKDRWLALGFLAPAVILLMIGLVVPAIRTTLLSFMNGNSTKFVGLSNYSWMFTEPDALRVLLNTLVWVVLVPSLATSIGLLYAVLIDKSRIESFAKSLIFMPMAISFVGASIIWRFIYEYRQGSSDQIGLLNQMLVWVGASPRTWLADSPLNTVMIIIVMVWVQTGFAMVVLSAAIKAIPAEINEAARIDGANSWQLFWQVTMPGIRPAVVVVVVTISIATLKIFDIIRTMTGGQFNTSVIANEMYNQSFVFGQTGRGSALAVVLFLLVSPIVVYQVRQLRQRRREAL